MSGRTGSPTRFGAALVLVGYIGYCSVSGAAPATPHPDTQNAARLHADLTRNKEALRKVLTAPARGATAQHRTAAGHDALAGATARTAHGIPVHAGTGQPNTAAAGVKPGGPAIIPPTALNRPRIAPAAGTLGGPLATNTLTPFRHSPAAPVTLGGAPVRRNAGYSTIDGSAFHHKP
jgi:hypothetical protein